jgi:hypothetical protein
MQRRRLMPPSHWDWRMPVKGSHDWSVEGDAEVRDFWERCPAHLGAELGTRTAALPVPALPVGSVTR